jgi:hypothetical protein
VAVTTARTAKQATRAWEAQFDVARWLASDRGEFALRAFYRTSLAAKAVIPASDPTVGCAALRATLVRSLTRGRTVYVSATMTALAQQSIADFGAVPLTADQMPSPDGWMWLEAPLWVRDLWGDDFAVRAVQWTTIKGRVGVIAWSDHTIDDTFTTSPDMAERNKLFTAGYSIFDIGVTPLGEPLYALTTPDEVRANTVEALRRSRRDHHDIGADDRLSRRIAELDAMTDDAVMAFYDASVMLPLAQVLWALCGQSLAVPTRPGRPAVRRVSRWLSKSQLEAHLADLEADVHVLALRRQHQPDLRDDDATGGDGGRPGWTHRWTVRPHWRWQPYRAPAGHACEHCGALGIKHRRILIGPYVKGPDHLPLVDKNRVDVLVR